MGLTQNQNQRTRGTLEVGVQEYKLTVIDKFGEKREHLCHRWEWNGPLMIYRARDMLIDIVSGVEKKTMKAELTAIYQEFNSFEIEEVEDESEG